MMTYGVLRQIKNQVGFFANESWRGSRLLVEFLLAYPAP
jgi:hypothetical protein